MSRRFWILPVLALLMAPAFANAQFKQGDFEVTLSGNGNNGPDFDGVSVGAAGSFGWFFTDQLEVSIRQSLTYTDVASDGNLDGSTRVALDYNFDLGRVGPMPAVVPYVGAEIGYVYGDSVNDSFEAGPEAGVKFFVNPNTFIFVSAEYQFFFDNGNGNFGDQFSDGQFIYGLGIGFKF